MVQMMLIKPRQVHVLVTVPRWQPRAEEIADKLVGLVGGIHESDVSWISKGVQVLFVRERKPSILGLFKPSVPVVFALEIPLYRLESRRRQ